MLSKPCIEGGATDAFVVHARMTDSCIILFPEADVVARVPNATWFEWDNGSRPFHLRWPSFYQRVIRNRLKVHFLSAKPQYKTPQRGTRDPASQSYGNNQEIDQGSGSAEHCSWFCYFLDMLDEVQALLTSDLAKLPCKRLEQIRGFLQYVTRTYTTGMIPYLIGFHLSLEGERMEKFAS